MCSPVRAVFSQTLFDKYISSKHMGVARRYNPHITRTIHAQLHDNCIENYLALDLINLKLCDENSLNYNKK